MQIKISDFISSRIYKKINNISVGFILDEKNHLYYILKGKIADLWDIVLSGSSYENVLDYAVRNNLEKELKQFLSELKQKNIIDINLDLRVQNYEFLNSVVFYKDKRSFSSFYDYIWTIVYTYNKLHTLTLQLCYRCNLNCKHCFNPKNRNNEELDFETCKKAIDEAYELGITTVGITGGECTIHKDFIKIAEYIRKRHLSLRILTNGIELYNKKNLLKRLISLYPNEIQLSLYSMEPNIHDNITGQKNSYYKTLYVIKELRKAEINVVISCPIISINKNHYKEIENFAKDFNIKFDCYCSFINNKENHNNMRVDNRYIKEFFTDQINKNGDDIKKFRKDGSLICNYAGIALINIAPNLDITPCNNFIHYKLGNLKNNSLKYVYNNKRNEYKAIFVKTNLKECFKHDYCQYCSYCPAIALYETEPLKKVDSFCNEAKMYYEVLTNLKKQK